MSTTPAQAPRRSDALRNRERVIAAAREVFAEQGIHACVPEVARRAGVGKATVYRSFATREHLVAALAAAVIPRPGREEPQEATGDDRALQLAA